MAAEQEDSRAERRREHGSELISAQRFAGSDAFTIGGKPPGANRLISIGAIGFDRDEAPRRPG